MAGRPLPREALFWEHEGNRAARVGDLKLVALGGRPWELYDMAADRTEQHDLAADRPAVVRDLAARWVAWAERCHVKEPRPGQAPGAAGPGDDAAD